MKKTKIIATLGPASNDINIISEMINNGVDVIRLNMSHATYEFCDDVIKNVRKLEKKLNKVIGIMIDTDGPCIRLDKLIEDKVFLSKDKEIKLYNYHVVCNNTQLSTNCHNLIEYLQINSEIKLSNGNVTLKVIQINNDNVICKIIEEGYIYSNQTVYIKDAYLTLPFLSNKDRESILYAIKNNVDFLALSYVRFEQDVLDVIDLLIENGNDHISIISKIENDSAYESLDEILKISDGVMVARGDLGIEMPLERLPFYQKKILSSAIEQEKLGIVATDFLNSMQEEIKPSRSEVSDIYNAIIDRCDAILLSDETTVGKYPVESVEVMRKIILEAENDFLYQENLNKTIREQKQDITTSIAFSVVDSSLKLNANCILANTISGYTARKISHFHPKTSILSLTPSLNTAHSLTLNYGIIPVIIKKCNNTDEIVDECIKKFKEVMNYKDEDIIIITGGFPLDNKSTNFMRIEKI